jgi:Zn-dependent alcohol dehydrogenases, class III
MLRDVRPLPAPFDDIAAARPATIALSGSALLGNRFLTKDLGFPPAERNAFGLRGLLPDRVLSIEEQMELELEHLRVKDDALERYIGLVALQERNSTLFYRVLAEHLAEFLPIVYTPTVGRACQEFSHINRRTRGAWITPADRDRILDILRQSPYEDVRLIVVTDNERILGLGDQGAGGMAIPIGKLALYTAACGIHPAVTLPVSLDVGTDNPALLNDPLYLGYRAPRLRGAEYDALVEAFVAGVAEVWPGCIIQWEDFKQQNALRILDRYRSRVPSFNDDVQGTSAIVVSGLIVALRELGLAPADARIVLAGAGAAGTGIARLLRMLLAEEGVPAEIIRNAVVAVDSHGLVHEGRDDLDATKHELAAPAVEGPTPDLLETVRRYRPNILVGTTGVGGSFSETIIRTMASATPRPVIMPLSNPTSATEATPADILDWTDGKALVATGSPFEPVERDGHRYVIGQANNVFIFPGLGLGAIVAEAKTITDRMFLLAARTLADSVTPGRSATGALYPPVADLRAVSRAIALAVAREAIEQGLAGISPASDVDLEAMVDAAMWWPAYVPYEPAGPAAPDRLPGRTVIRAAVFRDPGQAVAIERLALADPRAGEVRVRMTASGVCHSDLHVRDGDWPRPGPVVMGHEGAGVVEAVGPGVTTLRPGQPVALSWLVPCGTCRACRRQMPWACSDSPSFRHRFPDGATAASGLDDAPILSYSGIGTMAEATVVPVAAAIPLPDGVDAGVAALIGCCVSTGVGAVLKTAAVPAGASVAIIGLGGVGLSCIMGATLAGAGRIVAIDRVAGKLDTALTLGATDGLLASDDDADTIAALHELTGGGPDFVFEAIGQSATVELAIEALPIGGTAVLVGMTPAESRATFAIYPFVDGSRRILGSNYGFAHPAVDFPRYAQLYLDGRLPVDRLIDRRIGLDDLESAFDRLRAGEGLRQVIVFG